MSVFATQNCVFIVYSKNSSNNPDVLSRKPIRGAYKEYKNITNDSLGYLYIETEQFQDANEYFVWNEVYTAMDGAKGSWTKEQWELFFDEVEKRLR